MNKVWGTPILDEERGTLQQSPNNYIEGLEKRAYGVICTGIFPLTPDEVQIAKEALRENNGEGEASVVRTDKVNADEIWLRIEYGGAEPRVNLGALLKHYGRRIAEEAQRNTALEQKVRALEEQLDILELKSHTHSPKEQEHPSEIVEELGEAHLTAYGWVRVSRRRDGSMVLTRSEET